MLIAPSGSLKSQLLMHLQRAYPTTCICDSNWHYGKLLKMKASFYNGTIRSIIVPEMASIYAGDPRTGGRIEAMFLQMAGEASHSTNASDTRFERYEMRASIFGAMTPDFATKKHAFWEEGFHRRFLWAHMAMENEEVLMDYLTAGKQADLDIPLMIEPQERYIPQLLDYKERMFIRRLLVPQKAFGPNHTRFAFLCRAASAMKWHYQKIGFKVPWQKTMADFSVCLGEQAALLVIPPEPISEQFRKREEHDNIAKSRKMLGTDVRRNSLPRRSSHHLPSPKNRLALRGTPPRDHRHKHNGGPKTAQTRARLKRQRAKKNL